MKTLTPKQESFCLAYLETGNASEAYRRSYSHERMKPETVNRNAKKLLDNDKITTRLKELNSAAVSAAVMTRQEALERLSGFARTDLADLVEFGEYEIAEDADGAPVMQASWRIKPETLRDKKKMAAIAELTASKDGIKIKTHSPLAAIQQLAKMQGWEAAQKLDHTSTDGSMTPKPAGVDAALVSALVAKLTD